MRHHWPGKRDLCCSEGSAEACRRCIVRHYMIMYTGNDNRGRDERRESPK